MHPREASVEAILNSVVSTGVSVSDDLLTCWSVSALFISRLVLFLLSVSNLFVPVSTERGNINL